MGKTKEKIIELEEIDWQQLEKRGQVLKVPISEIFEKILPILRKEAKIIQWKKAPLGEFGYISKIDIGRALNEDICLAENIRIEQFLNYLEKKYIKKVRK
jgi:hypothetical protein